MNVNVSQLLICFAQYVDTFSIETLLCVREMCQRLT